MKCWPLTCIIFCNPFLNKIPVGFHEKSGILYSGFHQKNWVDHAFLSPDIIIRLNLDQIEWLDWLANATPEQRAKWSLEPGRFAVYWEDLDDGIEIEHVLSLHPIVSH